MVIRTNNQANKPRGERPVPTRPSTGRIRCVKGGEWKERSQFSPKSLEKYDRMVTNGEVTPEHSGVMCREHSPGAEPIEYKCEGPCRKVRNIAQFSKNSRKLKKMWCMDCTAWKLSDLEDRLPPPGTELSPDEIAGMRGFNQEGTQDVADDGLFTVEGLNGYRDGTESVDTGSFWGDTESLATIDQGATRTTTDQIVIRPSYDAGDQTENIRTVEMAGRQPPGKLGCRHLNMFSMDSTPSLPDPDDGETGSTITTSQASTLMTIQANKSGWAKPRKSKVREVPDYIRNDAWLCDEGDGDDRRFNYESDDSF